MRTDEHNDDGRHENDLLDRATAALRESFEAPVLRDAFDAHALRDESDASAVPQTVVDNTIARLRALPVSQRAEKRTPPSRRFGLQRIGRVAVAVVVLAALLFWLITWPSQTSALAQAVKNVQTAKSVVFELRAKIAKQQEQVCLVKILGGVIRQEEPTTRRFFFVNHRTGETLNSNTLGWAISGHVPDQKPLNGDPITQLLGLLKVANERLPGERLNGVACLVYSGHDTSPLGVAAPGDLKLWIDAQTKLPVRVEARWPNREWDHQGYVILENFKWNVDLDPAEFDMHIVAPELVQTEFGMEPAGSAPAEARDQSGLRLIGLALHRYLDQHQHRFPPAVVIGTDGKTPHSWRVEILPFLGKGGEALYRAYRLNEPWDSPANKLVLAQMPDVFRSAGDDLRSTNSSFFALVGPGTLFEGQDGIKIDQIFDGTSTTILLVEAKRGIPWTKPEDIPYDPAKPLPPLGGSNGNEFLTLFADRVTVRRLSTQLDEKTLKALIGRNDATVIDLDRLSR